MIKLINHISIGCILVAVCASSVSPERKRTYVSQYENVLGTSLELKFQSSSEANAVKAEQAALAEIDRLNLVLSAYTKESEFSKWAATNGTPVKISPELYEVLDLFEQWRTKTNGALDASAELAGKVWKNAAIQQELPSVQELNSVVGQIKQKHYLLNPLNHTATHLDNVPLALNSFAKSYIISRAAQAASAISGVSSLVVNIGGDIVVKGNSEEIIQLRNPLASAENDAPLSSIKIRNRAVATSGNYRRGFEIDGKWYSHIIDPRTAIPAGHIISATVVASDASQAGALATAFNVLSVEESLQLGNSIAGIDFLLVTKDGKRIESKNWNSLEIPVEIPVKYAVSESRGKDWDPNYELIINLELAKIEGMRVHRPFVAVWVEDENKKPVRNLAIWFNKPKWLPDMKSWYRVNGADFSAPNSSISSVSSATRSPGKYMLRWDGKDDGGKLVKAGRYTIYIEAAREHGTYQLISQVMDFKGKAQQIALNGNIEVSSASLDYRKKQADTK